MKCRPATARYGPATAPGLSTPRRSAIHRMPIPVDKSGGQLVDKALPAATTGG
jgi:hypothetical protein